MDQSTFNLVVGIVVSVAFVLLLVSRLANSNGHITTIAIMQMVNEIVTTVIKSQASEPVNVTLVKRVADLETALVALLNVQANPTATIKMAEPGLRKQSTSPFTVDPTTVPLDLKQ